MWIWFVWRKFSIFIENSLYFSWDITKTFQTLSFLILMNAEILLTESFFKLISWFVSKIHCSRSPTLSFSNWPFISNHFTLFSSKLIQALTTSSFNSFGKLWALAKSVSVYVVRRNGKWNFGDVKSNLCRVSPQLKKQQNAGKAEESRRLTAAKTFTIL